MAGRRGSARAPDRPTRPRRRRASRRRSRGPARRRRSGAKLTTGEGRPGSPRDSPRSSTTRPAVDEVADEPADAAAGEAGALAELGARQRPFGVQCPHERTEVGAADALAALALVPHRPPSPLIARRRLREFVPRGSKRHVQHPTTAPPVSRTSTRRDPQLRRGRSPAVVQSARAGARGRCGSGGGTGARRHHRMRLAAAARPAAPDVPRFVADGGGIDHRYEGDFHYFVGGGVAAFDCDDDGRSELFLAGGSAPAALFHNDSPTGGALRFTRLTSPVTDLPAVTGAYPLDIDSDGQTDLVVLRVGPGPGPARVGRLPVRASRRVARRRRHRHLDRRVQRDVGGERTSCRRWRSAATWHRIASRARTAAWCGRSRAATRTRRPSP